MTSPKPAVELPRFLLVTNTSASRLTSSSLLYPGFSATPSRRPSAHNLLQQRSARRTLSTITSSPASASKPQSQSLTFRSGLQYYASHLSRTTAKARTSDVSYAPIKHNGVYVAVFKPARRAFHATPVRERDHRFDTLKVVQRLKDEGFSEEQAVALMRVLDDVVEESIQNLTRTMVLKEGLSLFQFFPLSRASRLFFCRS